MNKELVQSVAAIARHAWRGVHWVKVPGGSRMVREPLKFAHLEKHVNGGPGVGVACIVPGTDTTRIAVLDFDSHKGEVPWPAMCAKAREVAAHLEEQGLRPIPFRSSGGKGIHLIMLWDEEQDAYSVRQLLASALQAFGLTSGTKGVKHGEVEIFPKQDQVASDGFGNMFILPLTGESLALDDSSFALQTYEYAESTTWPLSKSVERQARQPVQTSSTIDPASLTTSLAEIRSALAAIPNEGDASLDYDAWRNVIFAIHHETGGAAEGLALAHEFSKRSTKYDPEFLDERVWPYVRSGRGGKVVTGRTLFQLARKHGFDNTADDFEVLPERSPDELDIVEAVKQEQVSGRAQAPEAGTSNPGATTPARFRIIPALEFSQRPAPDWIVDDVLPRAELAVIFGESGSGKSFLCLDIVAAIARGIPWRGHAVQQGNVVYIAAEGAAGFRNRLVAYGMHHDVNLTDFPLGVIPDSPNLLEKKDVVEIAKALAKYGRVDVVVVDTFAQVTPGANENAAEDVSKALANCRALHRVTGALVILIHHAGKDLSKGARGWSGMRAAADCEIEIARSDEARCATLTKLKDGSDGAKYPFRLNVVVIGEGRAGRAVDSCVVEYIEQDPKGARVRREPPGEKARLVWQVVNDMVDLDDGPLPVDAVISEAVRRQAHDPAKRDRRRDMVVRALEALQGSGFIRLMDEELEVCS